MKLIKVFETVFTCCFIMIAGSGCAGRTVVIEDIRIQSADENPKGQSSTDQDDESNRPTKKEADAIPQIKVYVCGAVENPGVYELAEESRICDAVALAGGYTEEADLTGINPAQKITDEEYIRIYTAEEISEVMEASDASGNFRWNTMEPGSASASAENGKINLNTASRDELMTLPGIGESKADAIVSYRETNGAFSSVEQIMEIRGIKNSVFNRIRDLITV